MDSFEIIKKEIEDLKHEIKSIEKTLENYPVALETKLKKRKTNDKNK